MGFVNDGVCINGAILGLVAEDSFAKQTGPLSSPVVAYMLVLLFFQMARLSARYHFFALDRHCGKKEGKGKVCSFLRTWGRWRT